MRKQQNGSILVLAAGILIVLTGFAVLAIDVGRIYLVRNELQNAADSAALAGANCLDRQSQGGSTTECTITYATTLNWTRANAKAVSQLSQNSASNIAISTIDSGHQVNVGYWNVNGGTTLQPTSLSPLGPCTVAGGVMTTACDKPAVSVSITKDAGKNNGPIAMLTAAMFGGANVPMTAKAVAVISSPGIVLPGNLIPIAINKCMFDKYWDVATNSPKLANSATLTYTDSSNPNNPVSYSITQVIGQPWKFRIGSSLHYGLCDSGQWTSFNENAGNSSNENIVTLINTGNTNPLGVGDNTHLNPGTRATDYTALDDRYPTTSTQLGADVSIVVVNADPLSKNIDTPVVAFGGFHIDDIKGATGPNPKFYIEGHLISNSTTSGSSGIGPFYGTYTPPRLAQ